MNDYLKDLDQKQLAKEIDKALWANFQHAVAIHSGHSDLHVAKTDSEMLERLFEEGKDAVSTFLDEDSMEEYISYAISREAYQIAGWLQTRRSEYDTRDAMKYKEYQIMLNMKPDIVGRGFRNDLKEYHTNTLTLVLSREYDAELAPYGFILKTAYADIREGRGIATGKAYTKQQVLDSRIINFNSPEEEAAYCLMGEYPGVSIKAVKDRDGEPEIAVSTKEGNNRYIAFVKQNIVHSYKRTGIGNKREYVENFPDTIRVAVKQAQSTLHTICLSRQNLEDLAYPKGSNYGHEKERGLHGRGGYER